MIQGRAELAEAIVKLFQVEIPCSVELRVFIGFYGHLLRNIVDSESLSLFFNSLHSGHHYSLHYASKVDQLQSAVN